MEYWMTWLNNDGITIRHHKMPSEVSISNSVWGISVILDKEVCLTCQLYADSVAT